MKTIVASLALAALLFSCSNSKTEDGTKESLSQDTFIIEEQTDADTLKGSLKARASNNVNGVKVGISYSSPAVRGRVIWGSLVPYEKVWVSGAHMATSIEFDRTIRYKDTKIPAGKYGLFTIPGTDSWTIVLNKNWEQHLTDEYDQKDDVIRFEIMPEKTAVNQERLMYEIDQTGEGYFSILFSWEKVKIEIPFKLR